MKIKKRRNCRKSQTMNVMTGRTFNVALIILSLMVAVVMNLVAESRCTQVRDSIGEKEKLLTRLEQDRQRESAAWEQMTTASSLERALVRHGLNMRYPKSEQVIRMDASGTPRYGQRSVELAKNRLSGSATVASNVRRPASAGTRPRSRR